MQIGVTFPQNEIGADPAVIREYIQAVEGAGYKHLVIYDHVLGADPTNRPGWQGYTHKSLFHEPFVFQARTRHGCDYSAAEADCAGG